MGEDSIPQETVTDWYEVSPQFFQLHSGDIGMEIASKVDGKVSKQDWQQFLEGQGYRGAVDFPAAAFYK